MNILQIISWVLWIVALVLLIISKNAFNQPESGLSKKVLAGFLIPAILVSGIYIWFLIGVYKNAYYPDYEYEKTAQKAGFHIYRPEFLPDGQELNSKYYIYEKSFAGKNNAVRSVYSIPFTKLKKGESSHLILLTQVNVDQNFDIPKFLEAESGKPFDSLKFTKININTWPDQPAYLQTNSGDTAAFIYVITTDNVLISLGSLAENGENMIKIAESLR